MPALANKYFCVSARLSQVSAPGYVVYKGTPLLPKQEEEEQEESDTDSLLQEPLSLQDIIEVDDDSPAEGVGSASSSSRLDSSLERRSRSPPPRAQPDLSDLGGSGKLGYGRPLPPEPPVAFSRPSQGPSETGPKQKARPKPRPSLEVAPVLRVLRCFNDSLRFARDVSEALDYKGGVRFILSLDYHRVFDRCFRSTGEVLRVLNQRPEILVLLCSKCSTDALITNACDEVGNLCRSTYSVRHFPCFFIPRVHKSDKLWESLGCVSSLRGLPLIHVDDKFNIVSDFNRWNCGSWRGVHLPSGGRKEISDVVLPAISG